ncbi:MAG TPA: PBP1A family penicillin-binding protein [Pyrinomonadaceae bacterium]|nr:PBP1A family penicillin-binding protein [Pyrinomonadaceae bacterium]
MRTEAKSTDHTRRPRRPPVRRALPRSWRPPVIEVGEDQGRWPRLSLALRAAGLSLAVIAFAAVAAFTYFYWHYSNVVDERLASGYLTSRAGIYAAPRVLRTGQKLSPERLAAILRRAGYVDAGEAGRVWSGRFRLEGGGVLIEPSPTSAAGSAQGFASVRVGFDGRGHVKSITADGTPLDSYALEPETLTNDAGVKTAGRDALTYADIPPVLARAILSVEDRRFFEHGGLDLWGVARALKSWGGAGEDDAVQGGSTITQQLVKNTYLTPERTLRRKLREAVLASVVERRLPKQDIFALYCNEIYLGQRGSVAVRGVQQAARLYFGKELKGLTLAEAATIAGMIRSPGRYAPDRHPEQARSRRNAVLAAMLRDRHVTPEEARAASAEPVRVVTASAAQADAVAPHFIDYVNRAVEARRAAEPEGGELRVYTTLDLELQQLAERAVTEQLARLEKVFRGAKRPDAALVALDPRTGHVLAMVGGRDYAGSQLNRATDARRQPGSVFKPVVYAAALEGGVSPLTLSLDAPREFAYDRRARYRPANYGGGYSMHEVTLRAALVRSLNVVTVETAMRAGLSRVSTLAEKLGLPRPEPYPSLALGTTEATPLEVATAYTAFAAGGRVARPTPLLRVDDGTGGSGDIGEVESAQVLKPSTSYMLTDMLGAVIERGTARAARGALKGVAAAGKTGTARDGWFAGYTPNLVCVVWVGFDDGTELGLTGADSALPVWTEFVGRAIELRPELGGEYFERPASITTVEVDSETGLRASASCPHRERVAVTHALAPMYECFIHSAPLPMPTMVAYEETELAAPPATAAIAVPTLPPTTARRTPPAPASAGYDFASLDERPAARATRVEIGRDGRRRLTNDLTVAPVDDDWPR